MYTRSRLPCVIFFVGVTLLFSSPSRSESALTLPLGATVEGLVTYANSHNPDLLRRQEEIKVTQEKVKSASALPDPSFQIELMDVTNAMSQGRSASLLPGQVGTSRYKIFQEVPFWGKRDLRVQLALAQVSQAKVLRNSSVLEINRDLKIAFARYYEAIQQVRILQTTLQLLDTLHQSALAQYRVGLAPQQDVIQAQSEITSVKIKIIETEQFRQQAIAKLNVLLPRQADAPLAVPKSLPKLPTNLALNDLTTQAYQNSPTVAYEQWSVIIAKQNRDLVWRDRYPDFKVGLANNQPTAGRESWDVMVEVGIPLQQESRRAQERASEHQLDVSYAQVDAAKARLTGKIGEAFVAFQSNRQQQQLLQKTLLPQVEATLQSAQVGYQAGKVNFNTVIEAGRQILRTHLDLLAVEVETYVDTAELEFLVGKPL